MQDLKPRPVFFHPSHLWYTGLYIIYDKVGFGRVTSSWVTWSEGTLSRRVDFRELIEIR